MKKLTVLLVMLCLLTACGGPAVPQPLPPATQPAPPSTSEAPPAGPADDGRLLCSLTVRCDKLVGNPDLDPEKAELIPADGVLFAAEDVEFFEGETVFHVLQRTMKQNRQHLEFVQTPLYDSAYIEGICNLYAYDAGDLSGWMYAVNGEFPNYGCSHQTLQPGDAIVWHYTCDLGADLGAADKTGNN